ncbi:T9SS type A sorting domain-containing protein [bacterium]|nr:T9SS type A sorting domain-containing protein [bacterium]
MTARTVLGGFCTLLMIAMPAMAQPDSLWSRTFGGTGRDDCYAVRQTLDGGYILGGSTSSYGAGSFDIWLIKTDSLGMEEWSRTFGGSGFDDCNTIHLMPDGGFLVGGVTNSFGAGETDAWLLRTNANGDSLWSRTYGGSERDGYYALQQTPDSGYILVGYTESFGAGDSDIWMLKIDANGDSLWSRTFGGSSIEYGHAVQQTTDGGYMLAGRTLSFGAGNWDFWFVKTDENGDSLWSRTYGGDEWDECWVAQQTTDGGYALAGFTWSFGSRNWNFWLLKTDANGDSLWNRIYGRTGQDQCEYLKQMTDGGYVLAGVLGQASPYGHDFWLIRTDTNGVAIWTRTFHRQDVDWCHTVDETSDGGFIMAGSTSPWAENEDIWLIKTTPDPCIPAPPDSFERVSPEDSVQLYHPYAELVWTRSIDPNGDDVTYLIHIESPTYGFPDPADYTTTDTSIEIDIPWPLEHLDEIHAFYWTVHAAAAGDTVEASNGTGVFLMDIIGAADEVSIVPLEYSLSAHPNPFNPSTRITFDLVKASHVTLKVFDVLGRDVATLVNKTYSAGTHSVTFDGSHLPSGIYFYRLLAGDFIQTKKMVLLK